MTITEYFCRMCAAWLDPNSLNIYARDILGDGCWFIDNLDSFEYLMPIHKRLTPGKVKETIQLRKEGVNLYELEWRKPTEQDVGKMCWFWNDSGFIMLSELHNIDEYESGTNLYRPMAELPDSTTLYCLLADHGKISPTEADFIKVYGVQNYLKEKK